MIFKYRSFLFDILANLDSETSEVYKYQIIGHDQKYTIV